MGAHRGVNDEDGVRRVLVEAGQLRDQGRHEDAIASLGTAAASEPRLSAMRAMLAYEAWLPARGWLQEAVALNPGDLGLVRNLAGSLAADGDAAAGQALLAAQLAKTPAWTEGQYALAQSRATHGDKEPHPRVARGGGAGGRWSRRLAVLVPLGREGAPLGCRTGDSDRAERRFVEHRGLFLSRLFLEAESGASRDPHLFDEVAELGDPGTDLARVRHGLRLGEAAAAEGIAAQYIDRPGGRIFWPYISLAWRMLGDDRIEWFERPDSAVSSQSLGYTTAELAGLTAFVRSLHVTTAPQIDQSVRSGTQTERSILLHHHPLIAELRKRLDTAIDRHVASLPEPVAGHPWLGTARAPRRIAGSWSVRLGPGGHHVPHTHPHGWLSSALHLSLPVDGQGGALAFGLPPPELELDLPATRIVDPVEGRVQLFPSTTWHSTTPIAAGERLTLAFDVAMPPG